MTSIRPRDEHVLAAAWAADYVRANGGEVASVAVNGTPIVAPCAQAAAIREGYRTEPHRGPEVGKLLDRARRTLSWVKTKLAYVFPGLAKPRALPPPRPRVPENVRETVRVGVTLVSGATATVPVTLTLRNETIALLGVSMNANAGALVCFFPGIGLVPALIGAGVAGAHAATSYASGAYRQGHAWVRTMSKCALLGVVDCIPFLASAVLSTTLFGAHAALEHYRAGDGLVDGTKAKGDLYALAHN